MGVSNWSGVGGRVTVGMLGVRVGTAVNACGSSSVVAVAVGVSVKMDGGKVGCCEPALTARSSAIDRAKKPAQ